MNTTATPHRKPPAKVVVLGNEKGGSGKSTTAAHFAIALLHAGLRIAVIDLDIRQGSLSRYFENRRDFISRSGISLPVPDGGSLELWRMIDAAQDPVAELAGAINRLRDDNDYIILDTPGSNNPIGQAGHSHADILITPVNESFLDLDGLGRISSQNHKVVRPGHYAQMVFEQKIVRAQRDGGLKNFGWIVMRNRMSQLGSRNRRAIEKALKELSQRVGFKTAPGFSERVIFRELFLDGLTVSDLRTPGLEKRMNLSHLAARQELRALLHAAGLPWNGV